MNQWDRFEIMLNTVVDDTFAETFLFQPMSEGTIAGEEPDQERPQQEIKAIFTSKADLADIKDMHGIGKAAKFGSKISTGTAILSVDQTQFTELPRQGDRFKRLERRDEPVFRAITITQDGARLVIAL